MPDKKLHDEIFDKLPDDFIRRMWNWARWLSGGSVTISTGLWDRVGFTGVFESGVPTLLGEGADTDKAVHTLAQRYQEALTIFWTYNNHTIAWMTKSTPRMRLWKVGSSTFRTWLDIGHEQLQSELARMGREAAERRANSEKALREK